MNCIYVVVAFLFLAPAMANTWTYQVNINGTSGTSKVLDAGKNAFEAGPYDCEVTPVSQGNGTEFRSLICAVGSATVSTGGLCTKKGSKFPSVQYAILNLNGTKNLVTIVVACKFD